MSRQVRYENTPVGKHQHEFATSTLQLADVDTSVVWVEISLAVSK